MARWEGGRAAEGAGVRCMRGYMNALPPPTRLPTSPQTALLWVVAVYEMRRPTKDKDFFYDLGAVVVNLPVGLVAWGVVCRASMRLVSIM